MNILVSPNFNPNRKSFYAEKSGFFADGAPFLTGCVRLSLFGVCQVAGCISEHKFQPVGLGQDDGDLRVFPVRSGQVLKE